MLCSTMSRGEIYDIIRSEKVQTETYTTPVWEEDEERRERDRMREKREGGKEEEKVHQNV